MSRSLGRIVRYAHSAPWMKGRVRPVETRPLVDEMVLLFTGKLHGMSAQTWTQLVLPEGVRGGRVAEVAAGQNHALILMEDGAILSFGDNRLGQCGRALGANVYEDGAQRTGHIFHGVGVDSIAVGYRHTVVYKKGSRICRVAGQNEHHQLGLGAAYHHDVSTYEAVFENGVEVFGIPFPTELIPEEEGGIMTVSCGSTHTMMLMESGAVYGFGSAIDGQLGTGNTAAHNVPYAVKYFRANGIRLKDVRCGNACTLFIAEDGRVFGAGKMDEGRLGLEWSRSKPVTLIPKVVPLPFAQVGLVAPGLAHCAVSGEGGWYVCGGSQKIGVTAPMCKDHADIFPHRPLDAPPPGVHAKVPHQMRRIGGEQIRQLRSGFYHSVGLDSSGAVWGTGWAMDGQLGSEGDAAEVLSSSLLLHTNADTAAVAAAGMFSLIAINATPETERTWEGFPTLRLM